MFPLRDTIRARRFPVVNVCIIGVNVLVFMLQYLMGGDQLERLLYSCGLVPADFLSGEGACGWWSLVTSMFLHAGWWHLISNMYTLYIFGDNVEDRLGRLRYLAFYVLSGLAANAVHLATNANSSVPTIGASGAIAGVLGAYLLLYPRARVLTLVPIFYFARLVQVPAVLYLGFWFVSQLFNGLFALTAMDAIQSGGVAWWAHIGGFVFGAATIKLVGSRLLPPPPPSSPPHDRRYPPRRSPYEDRYRWRVIDDDA